MREQLANDPILAGILDGYFSIGVDTGRIDEAEGSFRALAMTGKLLPLLRLLFGHPLWSVSEAAASVVAGLLRKARTAQRNEEAQAYIEVIGALCAPSLPWRVRYGAMEAAFQIRLDEEEKHATFFKGVRLFYADPSTLRGLCAENLLSVILNSSDMQRVKYEAEFEREIRRWLVDEDCWVLEHVYRYFHALHLRNANVDGFMSGPQSPLVAGLDKWWAQDRETFHEHIETQKEERTRLP